MFTLIYFLFELECFKIVLLYTHLPNAVEHLIFLEGTMPTTAEVETTVVSTETTPTTFGKQFNVLVKP